MLHKNELMTRLEDTETTSEPSTSSVETTPKVKQRENSLKNIEDLDWSKYTILIAEDENHNFLYLESLLELTKVNIIRAVNGKQCVEIVRKNKDIDIILMDVQMPVMNGIEATRTIKSFRKDITIIAQTAFALKENKENCEAVGTDDFLTKPVRSRILIDTILKHLVKK